MESNATATHPGEQEIDLRELLDVFKLQRWFILGVTLTFTLIAVLACFLVDKKYEASTVLSPVSANGSTQSGLLRSLASQFGGLSSLAGLATDDSQKAEAIAVLQSDILTQQYITDKKLLQVLFANKWDTKNNVWKTNDPKKIPTAWLANRYFKSSIRTLTTDTKTGLVTLQITWKDPQIAAQWANDLVKNANNYLRAKAIDRTEKNIAYLNAEAAKADVVGIKQTIYTLLQSEINNAMLARGNEEYAFKVLDPATPSERPSSPRPELWIPAGFAGGLFVSFLAALMRKALQNR
jgi:uncharacterized protein involved in exopolysaccharide biosynthesis